MDRKALAHTCAAALGVTQPLLTCPLFHPSHGICVRVCM